jgi:hypothetical protein
LRSPGVPKDKRRRQNRNQQQPCYTNKPGLAQYGRISIANSDSEARAYMDAAFDAVSHRHVIDLAGVSPVR